MRLSFSTNRWKGYDLPGFIRLASEYRFDGIEIHSADELGRDPGEAYRLLTENRLTVPCIDLVGDIGNRSERVGCMQELMRCEKAQEPVYPSPRVPERGRGRKRAPLSAGSA